MACSRHRRHQPQHQLRQPCCCRRLRGAVRLTGKASARRASRRRRPKLDSLFNRRALAVRRHVERDVQRAVARGAAAAAAADGARPAAAAAAAGDGQARLAGLGAAAVRRLHPHHPQPRRVPRPDRAAAEAPPDPAAAGRLHWPPPGAQARAVHRAGQEQLPLPGRPADRAPADPRGPRDPRAALLPPGERTGAAAAPGVHRSSAGWAEQGARRGGAGRGGAGRDPPPGSSTPLRTPHSRFNPYTTL
ncbi:polyprotein [Frankliniella fusca]|uniref:Polyprotein n=1 Tax=Frankliniella fusca TaxID=407009 RepID=A0AAE1LB45_9NEOP|nr:polyprotein [Frankliniella fusca]